MRSMRENIFPGSDAGMTDRTVKQLTVEDLIKTKRDFITIKEITELMNMQPQSIRALCRDGKLGSTMVGRQHCIPPASILDFLNIKR